MFTRRQTLHGIVGLASGALAMRAGLARAAGQTLRIGYILPVQSQLGAGATVFADEVAKRTGGRFVVQQFPDSSLGGDVELLKGVQLGTLMFAISSSRHRKSLLVCSSGSAWPP
jgi:TRAP-type transport system periplasmic protein